MLTKIYLELMHLSCQLGDIRSAINSLKGREGVSIGENIKFLRKEKGFTQKELGDAVGLTDVAINRYEKNLREPKQETLIKISRALNVPYISLIGISLSDVSTKDLLAEIERRCNK